MSLSETQIFFTNFLFLIIFFKNRFTSSIKLDDGSTIPAISEKLYALIREKLSEWTVTMGEDFAINVETVSVKVELGPTDLQKNILITWTNQDEDLGSYILNMLQNLG